MIKNIRFMKRAIVLVIVFLIGFYGFSQEGLGKDMETIKLGFENTDFEMTEKVTENGKDYLSVNMNVAHFMYYFDDNDTCATISIFPTDNDAKDALMMKYNEELKKISGDEWQTQIDGKTAVLKMFDDVDSTIFLWKFEDAEK